MLSITEFPEEPERRESPRFVVGGKASCVLTELTGGHRWPAAIHDVSAGGLSLIVGQAFSSDALLNIELFNPAGTRVCSLRVRVVHAYPRPEGDWLIGCALAIKLSEDELRSLLESR